MPTRRRSRGHDRRHNTSSLVHSSGGTYTRSVSLSPSLPPFLSPSPSLVRALSIPSARTCVSSRQNRANTVQRSRAHACTHTRAAPRVRVRALSPLFFFSASSLAPRRREPHVPSSYSRSRLSAARESTHRDRAIY